MLVELTPGDALFVYHDVEMYINGMVPPQIPETFSQIIFEMVNLGQIVQAWAQLTEAYDVGVERMSPIRRTRKILVQVTPPLSQGGVPILLEYSQRLHPSPRVPVLQGVHQTRDITDLIEKTFVFNLTPPSPLWTGGNQVVDENNL